MIHNTTKQVGPLQGSKMMLGTDTVIVALVLLQCGRRQQPLNIRSASSHHRHSLILRPTPTTSRITSLMRLMLQQARASLRKDICTTFNDQVLRLLFRRASADAISAHLRPKALCALYPLSQKWVFRSPKRTFVRRLQRSSVRLGKQSPNMVRPKLIYQWSERNTDS